jgi:ectoine hydroxylase-related dioxygenase (phytanoyl-CoA dioxygenase family)
VRCPRLDETNKNNGKLMKYDANRDGAGRYGARANPSLFEYSQNGYFVAKQVIPHSEIDRLLFNFVGLVNETAATEFIDAHSPEFAEALARDHTMQSKVYDLVRKPDWLVEFSKLAPLTECARQLLGPDILLMSKIPFRIDVPFEIKELAVWHQDYFYVKGNTDIVTAWVPMQDTTYLNGCLSVMPGSHQLGPVEHDGRAGKRHYPTKHLDREIRLVEMEKGDALFFHSSLLHTGNINLSNTVRFSVQARYSPADKPTDRDMGEAIRL